MLIRPSVPWLECGFLLVIVASDYVLAVCTGAAIGPGTGAVYAEYLKREHGRRQPDLLDGYPSTKSWLPCTSAIDMAGSKDFSATSTPL